MSSKVLVNKLKSFGLHITIREPTRVTTNIDSTNVFATIVDYCISDHFGIELKVACNFETEKTNFTDKDTLAGITSYN